MLDFKVRVLHGDMLKYRGGIGGIHVPLHRKLMRWDSAERADFTVYGHHHTWTPGPKYLGNGALVGITEYARENAFGTWEPPCQGSFLVEANRGIRHVSPIFVSDRYTWRRDPL